MALLVGAVASNPRIGETVFDRLQESRARGIAAFAKVATCLSLTSAAAGALCGQLRDMGDCLSDPRIAHDPVDEVSVAVRDLSGILQGLMTGGENYRMDQAFREGHSSLKMLDRQAIKLQAVASITLINSQTIAGVDLGDYVKSLRNMASELKRGADSVKSGLKRISAAQIEAESVTQLAGKTLLALDADFRAHLTERQADNLRQVAARRRMEEMAIRVVKATQGEVRALITAIQFSDFFDQRLEHICLFESLATGALRNPMRALIAAQLWGLADDADQIVAAVWRALQQISDLGAEIAGEFGGESGGESGGERGKGSAQNHLCIRRVALENAVRSKQTVEPAILSAKQSAQLVRDDIDAAVTEFADLIRTTQAMTLSAFNAGLITSRGGSARSALSVLALAVHESVDTCGREILQCRRALSVIGASRFGAETVGIEQAAGQFAGQVDECAVTMATMEELLGKAEALRLQAVRSGPELQSAIETATAEVVLVLDAANCLRDIAQEFASDPRAIDVSSFGPLDLSEAFSLYSMERERDVHEALFGVPAGAEDRDPGTTTASLEDILF